MTPILGRLLVALVVSILWVAGRLVTIVGYIFGIRNGRGL